MVDLWVICMSVRVICEGFKVFRKVVANIYTVAQNDTESSLCIVSQSVVEGVEIPFGLVYMRVCGSVDDVVFLGVDYKVEIWAKEELEGGSLSPEEFRMMGKKIAGRI